jgi:torsin-1
MHFRSGVPSKPLVISFHGTPGTGKNYVADFIAKSLYKNGLKSKYVHKFYGRLEFPEAGKAQVYGRQLRDKIINAVSKCEQSLFIFDEVDKMPPGVFDTITALFDHHSSIGGLDFRRSIFLFLTNAAGVEIAEKLVTLSTKDGMFREETKLSDFERICELGAYSIKGGLENSGTIEAGVIDHFIPFLPLERRHVEKCIIAMFGKMRVIPKEEQVAEVMKTVTFADNTFANSGCKRLDKKVGLEVYKMRKMPY